MLAQPRAKENTIDATYSSCPQKYSTTELSRNSEWTKLKDKHGPSIGCRFPQAGKKGGTEAYAEGSGSPQKHILIPVWTDRSS